MLFNVKEDLKLIRDLKLNPGQLTFVKMLYHDPRLDQRAQRLESHAMTLEFQDLCPLELSDIQDLIDRDIILDLNSPGSKMYYDSFEINPKFSKLFALKVVPLVSGLEEKYPRYFYMEGKRYNAIDVDAAEIAESYLRAINKDVKMHELILDDLKWAVDNDLIKMGLGKFVRTKHWLSIRVLRSDQKKTVTNARLG